MTDGIEHGKLIIGGNEFTNFDFPRKLEVGRIFNIESKVTPLEFSIPDYNPQNWYIVLLLTTSDSEFQNLSGKVLNSSRYTITDGILSIGILGTFQLIELKCSEFDNNGA